MKGPSYYDLVVDNLSRIGITVELKPEEYGKAVSTTAFGEFGKMAIAPCTPFGEVDDWLYGLHFPGWGKLSDQAEVIT